MAVQLFNVCGTAMPKYSLTSQKPVPGSLRARQESTLSRVTIARTRSGRMPLFPLIASRDEGTLPAQLSVGDRPIF